MSGVTATLLISTLGAAPLVAATQAETTDQKAEAEQKSAADQPPTGAIAPPEQSAEQPETTHSLDRKQLHTSQPTNAVKLGSQQPESFSPDRSTSPQPLTQANSLAESTNAVIKLGEQQSLTTQVSADETIAKVQAHTFAGHEAATLYVRSIPVLTFIGSKQPPTASVKLGTQAPQQTEHPTIAAVKTLTQAASDFAPSASLLKATQNFSQTVTTPDATDRPLWRASELAAKLNQLNRDGVDASKITVAQTKEANQVVYRIKLDDTVLATVDFDTKLPDTTHNLETDALQATNRLRRLLGDAPPLAEVEGKPKEPVLAIGPIRLSVEGFASWYGPGFHGNLSASGEVFDENALTAAHRTLPFGTRVLVTNLENGLSVVVRVNDRGPFYGDRVIDLSAGAARILGLIQVGVAPVRIDVLDDRSANVPR